MKLYIPTLSYLVLDKMACGDDFVDFVRFQIQLLNSSKKKAINYYRTNKL